MVKTCNNVGITHKKLPKKKKERKYNIIDLLIYRIWTHIYHGNTEDENQKSWIFV